MQSCVSAIMCDCGLNYSVVLLHVVQAWSESICVIDIVSLATCLVVNFLVFVSGQILFLSSGNLASLIIDLTVLSLEVVG